MKRFLLPLLVLTVSASAIELTGDFKGPLGLQLYSLRDSFKADVPGSLDKVKAFGFSTVETAGTYGLGPEKLTAMFKEDEEACFFSSPEELVSKARWLLDNAERRQRIAAAGLQRVWADGHAVADRCRSLLQTLESGVRH